MARDPEALAHQEWLGYVQPVGLVVSIPALLTRGAHVNRNIAPEQAKLLAVLPRNASDEIVPEIRDFPTFAERVLGWASGDLVPAATLSDLEVTLFDGEETLRPTYAVKDPEPKDPARPWQLLVTTLPVKTDLDVVREEDGRRWHATPHSRFERLVRETGVHVGLLTNGTHLRLVYAPRGESSGHLTFAVADMATVAGRPIFAALLMLLGEHRLFTAGAKERLPALLAESRKYQNEVSTQLAGQVLSALFELLRGFQAADDLSRGELLRQVLDDDPNVVYSGLLTVLLRLVFLLFAEDRGLISSDSTYVNHYSVTGLFDRLRADAGRNPDTMDQRLGAWAQLLTLFRIIHEGASHGGFSVPARKGYLFDPDRYPFLEGRARDDARDAAKVPRVADGVVFRILSNLLLLKGERLSYRTLDVEQIGSVYEAIMGFHLETAQGPSIAVKPKKTHGAPTTINLDELRSVPTDKRGKRLAELTDQKLTGEALDTLAAAGTIDDILAALKSKIDERVTPNVVPAGAMILQPSDERRRSGSHYTPRILTGPIVKKTLEPVLKALGARPTPAQILGLKVCDPAMGSAAFLVEACRQLGDALVEAWHALGSAPTIPPDEDEVLHARRLIAQRCLYGVDKNPLAVDLGKLSLWLATLARDHPFTFVDHALRHGDSLVGLTRKQIADFHWLPTSARVFGQRLIEERIATATHVRQEIIDAGDEVSFLLKQQKLTVADESLRLVRSAGNLVIAAFFAKDNDKKRKLKRDEYLGLFTESITSGIVPDELAKTEKELCSGAKAIQPFHWEIEFPEVFGRENGGFEAIVGNPPFLGGSQLSALHGGPGYQEWLKACNEGAFGNADLSAYFFRRSWVLICRCGTFGFLATNTISEGGTRITGLQTILAAGGRIYAATRSLQWPGEAAVFFSVVHIEAEGVKNAGRPILDGASVTIINSRLLAKPEVDDPAPLTSNALKGFFGTKLGSSGFILANDEYTRLAADSHNLTCLLPYLGGEEVNTSPIQRHERNAISFGSEPLEYAMQFPELLDIVRARVKPERERALDHGPGKHGKTYWWQFTLRADPLYQSIRTLTRCLVTAITTKYLAFSFQSIRQVFAHSLVAFAFDGFGPFACLQSQTHNFWARLLSSYLNDRLRYSVSDAFHTFPFPENFESDSKLEAVGREYYEFRATLMVKNNEGLTKTYNRFHDPNETSPDIQRLRKLHSAMDRAVLDAYGWQDLQPSCEFLLDYDEEEEENEEPTRGRGRKKPWRYRWPDELRDKLLARLLELNKNRAEEEALSGVANEPAVKKAKPAARKPKKESDKPKYKSGAPELPFGE